MNILELNNRCFKTLITIGYAVVLTTVLTGCAKEKKYDYDYKVNDVTVRKPGGNKPNVKSTQEFISIVYYDLFGANINTSELTKLNTLYDAFGDKKLVEDMIIKNYLLKPGLAIPTKGQMRKDLNIFIKNAYKKFYNREPAEVERWYMNNLLTKDTTITPELIYYSFLTSNEYRNY